MRELSRKKEEIAAQLRSMLNVNVKFEKLSMPELTELYEAVAALFASVEAAQSSVQSQTADKGPLGLGILPLVQDIVQTVLPKVRSELMQTLRGERSEWTKRTR